AHGGAAVASFDDRTFGNDDDIGHHIPDDKNAPAHARRTDGLGVARAAMATAIWAATMALFSTSAMLETSDLPSVSSKMRLSRNGVSALRETPSCSAPRMASVMRASIAAGSSASASGIGLAT